MSTVAVLVPALVAIVLAFVLLADPDRPRNRSPRPTEAVRDRTDRGARR